MDNARHDDEGMVKHAGIHAGGGRAASIIRPCEVDNAESIVKTRTVVPLPEELLVGKTEKDLLRYGDGEIWLGESALRK